MQLANQRNEVDHPRTGIRFCFRSVASKSAESSSIDHLLLAAEYCNKVGSVDAAIEALHALKKIAARISS